MNEMKPTDKARAVPAKEPKKFFQSSREGVLATYVSAANATNAQAAMEENITSSSRGFIYAHPARRVTGDKRCAFWETSTSSTSAPCVPRAAAEHMRFWQLGSYGADPGGSGTGPFLAGRRAASRLSAAPAAAEAAHLDS